MPDLRSEAAPAPAGHVENPHVRHERLDIRFDRVAWAVIVLAITLMLAAYGAYRNVVWQKDGYRLPERLEKNTALPAEPRLEQLESHNPNQSASFHAQEHARRERLQQYGRTDDGDYVHIPIEQAMRTFVDRQQSKPSGSKHPRKSQGLVGGGDANSGRLLRGEAP